MDQSLDQQLDFIDDQLLSEIPHFENFLDRIGFKRIDGAVFGLLFLSARPLTSEEIEKALGLSQSAVSLSLKTLIHFGAVESRDLRQGRAKIHQARENSMAIVASVFRKREHEAVSEFRQMAERLLKQAAPEPARTRRLNSLITACELAEAVIEFVFSLAKVERLEHYRPIVRQVPKSFQLLLKTATPLSEFAMGLGARIDNTLATKIFKNPTSRN